MSKPHEKPTTTPADAMLRDDLPEVELAREMTFTTSVRTGPTVQGRRDKVRLDDRDFRGGRITVYLRKRLAVLYNPDPDRVTGEPILTRVPFDQITGWEPLSEAQRFHYYATEEEREAKRRKDEQVRLAAEAAAAEAHARVLKEAAQS